MPEQIDKRITRILERFEEIRGCTSCMNEAINWTAPMSEEEVAVYEKKKGIRLPEEYRRFITSIGANGNKLFYGIAHLDGQKEEGCIPEKPSPFTFDKLPLFLYMTEEELDNFDYDAASSGFLYLNTEGCGKDSILIVNSTDPSVYGTVWFFDFANDFGAVPMRDKKTNKPFSFLDWLEYWAEREATDGGSFSFADTAPVPPPPDNSDIAGRKMGWIK